MMFGISDEDLIDKNKIKILNGIAGSGKSTTTVSELRRLGSNFCLASFSNALKFAASDKFGCPTDTICGLEFINTPHPRYAEKEVDDFDTVVNDEILLDGVECINWMMNNVGKVNIIALTDSRQMLSAENGAAALKAFEKICSQKYTICVEITETKRARDQETKDVYADLFALNSNKLFTIEQAQKILKCDIVDMSTVTFDNNNTYLCHSNKIEHEIYKKYDLSQRRDIDLIPKNHISRRRFVDISKYPICDQITATDKRIDSYLQAANVATPTRFQGKEVEVGNECYFVVQDEDVFTGREIYTVGTRCQSIKSIHIAVINLPKYDDPKYIWGKPVTEAYHLDIPNHDKTYNHVSGNKLLTLISKHGKAGTTYLGDYITSGDNVIYSTLSEGQLSKFTIKNGDERVIKKRSAGRKRTIRSIAKKDTTLHFDFMPKVYELLRTDVTPPRIINPSKTAKHDFNKLCDIYSAFPTILNHCDMPKAGYLYEEYDKDLLNFYMYKGSKLTKGSLITEELAKKVGDSEYMFSTEKQEGCSIGRYTYEQCKASKEQKDNINKNFLWGILESDYYTRTQVVTDGEVSTSYIKHTQNNLELVACALWSSLCLVMLEAIDSIGADKYFIVTDGLYYNGDKDPVLPEWCDYRIEIKDWENNEKTDEKYNNVVFQTYEDLKPKKRVLTPEQKARKLEMQRLRRAKNKQK